jgi:HTH-type transcriptional regulator/antitoxin HigA
MYYGELLKSFPPRRITSQEQYEEMQRVVDALLDKGDLTADEEDYLDLLGTLIYLYEQQTVHIPDIWGVELIKAFLSERGLRQKDLVSVFKTESIVSAVLNGHGKLTVEHIEKLAEFFNVSPALFFKAQKQPEETTSVSQFEVYPALSQVMPKEPFLMQPALA